MLKERRAELVGRTYRDITDSLNTVVFVQTVSPDFVTLASVDKRVKIANGKITWLTFENLLTNVLEEC